MKKNEKNTDVAQIIMNPIRMRIVQYLLLHEYGTTTQMKEELQDIPIASLYRHIKILEENNLILVVKENKIRGTVEKVYQLNKENPMGEEVSVNQIMNLVNGCLLEIMHEFNQYLGKKDLDKLDLQKEMIFLSSCTLLLTDDEFLEFQQKMGELFNQYIYNKQEKNRKARHITFISSPIEKTGD